MCSHTRNQRGPHLRVQGRLPGGSNVGVEPINPLKSKLLEGRAGDCVLAARSAAPSVSYFFNKKLKQPRFLISADLQQLLPYKTEDGAPKKYPADPSCLISNKALQNSMFSKPRHLASHKREMLFSQRIKP